MATKKQTELAKVLERLEQLELRIQQLEAERVGRVEAEAAASAAGSANAERQQPARVSAPADEAISDEVVTVIAAAVAAFLGKRAHIRQIRFAGREEWAVQGRAAIMASHRWAVHRS